MIYRIYNGNKDPFKFYKHEKYKYLLYDNLEEAKKQVENYYDEISEYNNKHYIIEEIPTFEWRQRYHKYQYYKVYKDGYSYCVETILEYDMYNLEIKERK